MARLAAIVVAGLLALAGAGIAGGPAGAAAKRSAASPASGVKAKCAKQRRAARACRRLRVSAGYRRTGRHGRALLAPPAARPSLPGASRLPAGSTPAATAPAPVAPAGGGPPASPAGPAPVATSTIGAEAHDFGTFVLRLTKTAVPAGNLTIYFRNYDVSEHNLWLAPPAGAGPAQLISEAVGEAGGATKTVAVTPGTWRFYCSITGHESMTSTLAVQ